MKRLPEYQCQKTTFHEGILRSLVLFRGIFVSIKFKATSQKVLQTKPHHKVTFYYVYVFGIIDFIAKQMEVI